MYMTVNQASRLDSYPLPKVDELFATLAGGTVFSKLDLQHAYLQLPQRKTRNSTQPSTLIEVFSNTTDCHLECHLLQGFLKEQLMA